jgi:hypothetical protein
MTIVPTIIAANTTPTIIVCVCAWCGRQLGTIDGQGQAGTSHGICEQCAKTHFGDRVTAVGR